MGAGGSTLWPTHVAPSPVTAGVIMCPFATHREENFTLHLALSLCVEAGQPDGDEFGCGVVHALEYPDTRIL